MIASRSGAAGAVLALVALAVGFVGSTAAAQSYKRADARSTWPHHVEVYDAEGRKIDPAEPGARPPSMAQTCKKCHDLKEIQHGWHFNAASAESGAAEAVGAAGRPGQPWFLLDPRSGTELPLSYRGWPGDVRPDQVGIEPVDFAAEFGAFLPGGLTGYAGGDPEADQRRVVGELDIDCMSCHDASRRWSHERYAAQVREHNFAWAPAAAYGLIKVEGSAKRLPADLDLGDEAAAAQLPQVTWARDAFDVDGKVFFDVKRTPDSARCYACHSSLAVASTDPVDLPAEVDSMPAAPRWQLDEDVHLRAGMSCSDCHRNGIEHQTVRGFVGEGHVSGAAVDSLSCRGCHLDRTDGHGTIEDRGGRLGAPPALHRGLPPLHLEKLSCTVCHSGPWPGERPGRVQTSLAHGLGLASQTRSDADGPRIVEPVLRRDVDGVLRPYRSFWPTWWGREVAGGQIEPIAPADAAKVLRRTFRVRKDLRAEIEGKPAEEIRAGIVGALGSLSDDTGAAVLISGGKLWRVEGEALVGAEHAAAAPRSWAIAHDVRPARDAVGVNGCTDCHAAGAPFLHGEVVAGGLVPDDAPPTSDGVQRAGLDPVLVAAWEQSFQGRDAFKVFGVVVLSLVALVLLLHVFVGLDAILRLLRGGRSEAGR